MSFRLAWTSETLPQKLNWMERLRSSHEPVFEGDGSARSREKSILVRQDSGYHGDNEADVGVP